MPWLGREIIIFQIYHKYPPSKWFWMPTAKRGGKKQKFCGIWENRGIWKGFLGKGTTSKGKRKERKESRRLSHLTDLLAFPHRKILTLMLFFLFSFFSKRKKKRHARIPSLTVQPHPLFFSPFTITLFSPPSTQPPYYMSTSQDSHVNAILLFHFL